MDFIVVKHYHTATVYILIFKKNLCTHGYQTMSELTDFRDVAWQSACFVCVCVCACVNICICLYMHKCTCMSTYITYM